MGQKPTSVLNQRRRQLERLRCLQCSYGRRWQIETLGPVAVRISTEIASTHCQSRSTQSRAILPPVNSAASAPVTATGPPSGPACQRNKPKP